MIIYWLIKRFRRWREARRAERAAKADEPGRRPPARRPKASEPLDREAAISVRGQTKTYPGHEAVRGIDFDVQRGEIVAFLGPNGAGKTTTVEIPRGIEPGRRVRRACSAKTPPPPGRRGATRSAWCSRNRSPSST